MRVLLRRPLQRRLFHQAGQQHRHTDLARMSYSPTLPERLGQNLADQQHQHKLNEDGSNQAELHQLRSEARCLRRHGAVLLRILRHRNECPTSWRRSDLEDIDGSHSEGASRHDKTAAELAIVRLTKVRAELLANVSASKSGEGCLAWGGLMVLLIVVFSMSTIAGLILVAVCIVGIPFKYYSDRQKVFELEARVRDIDERLAQQKRIADA